jgi:hypothetical protein
MNQVKPYEKEVTIDNTKKVEFWTDLDVSYQGNASLIYEIEIKDGTKTIGELNCDAFDVNLKMFATETAVNDRHNVNYQGKLHGFFMLRNSRIVLIRVIPVINGNYTALRKFDLIIKQ